MKHTGVINNTGKNVVVVFMSLPDDPEYSLVVDTDALPDSFNDTLRKIVESVDGQNAQNLADILGRRMTPDGSNTTILQKLHQAGRLQKVSVDLISMTPRRGLNWPLRQVLDAMKQNENTEAANLDDLDPETRAQVVSELGKFNVHATNQEGTTAEGQKQEAAGLLKMAELLEADAATKRNRAYRLDPSLNKKNKPAEKVHVVTKAEAKTKAPKASTKTVKA
jgi:hypothetical protein